MLPGLGFAELLVLAIVALVVVGPRDLPRLARQVGSVVRSIRGMAAEFRQSFDEMGRAAELDELRKEIDQLKRMEPLDEMRRELRDIENEMTDLRDPHHRPQGEVQSGEAMPDMPENAEVTNANKPVKP